MSTRTMTYRELGRTIQFMTEDQQMSTVTLFIPGIDEYYPATLAYTDDECDVLDPSSPVLTPID
jgi:hypothetical protein